MQSLFFFIVALAILIVVHEFGHFWVARRCGVKVLKFSVGFGRPLWKKLGKDGTEYIVAAIPLGGYVKMLDEREGDVPPEQLHQAFTQKSLAARTAIVAAGPIANLLFAAIVYWVIFVSGIPGLRSVVGEIKTDSPAAYANFKAGDEIKKINGDETPTWLSVHKVLVKLSQSGGVADITVNSGGIDLQRKLDVAKIDYELSMTEPILPKLGFVPVRIELKPIIGLIVANGPAERSGLRVGDELYSFNGELVTNWAQWVEIIQIHPNISMDVAIVRHGEKINLSITPNKTADNIGKIGAAVDASKTVIPEQFQAELRLGPISSVTRALQATWDDCITIIKNLIGMLSGTISSKNIGGPITIAQIAGASAEQGVLAFIGLLAVLSVNLGILNLLPIPILDGGHLAMYFVEWMRGKPISKEAQLQGQKVGVILLISLMFLAFFNDLSRVFGS